MRGSIKRLVQERGFGFIRGEDGVEYFFHRSALHGAFESLREGQVVSFEPDENSAKGPRAEVVEVAA